MRNILFKTTGVTAVLLFVLFVLFHQAPQAQSANQQSKPGILQFLPQETKAASTQPKLANHVDEPTPDVGSIMNQINALNASIFTKMNECIAIVQEGHSTISDMRETEAELNEQIADINDDLRAIPNDDPDRKQKRTELIDQRDDINNEKRELLHDMGTKRSDFNAQRRTCQSELSRLRSAKNRLESQLSGAYSRTVNLNSF